MNIKNPLFVVCSAGLLALAACQSSAPTGQSEHQSQSAAPSEADVRQCEALTKRILTTPHYDVNLVNAVYAPRLRFLILRGLNAEPGTDHWINWDYVYETQDDNPNVLSTGPGKIEGNRVRVPVVMQWPGQPAKTKSWTYELVEGSWKVTEVTELDGTSLSKVLEG